MFTQQIRTDMTAAMKARDSLRVDTLRGALAAFVNELAAKELSELKIIESYLPQMASREDIEKVARAKKEELDVTDASGAGKLTGVVMKEFAGTAAGGGVKEVIASLFA